MDTNPTHGSQRLSQVSTSILALTAVFAALTQLTTAVRELVTNVPVPAAGWWTIFAVCGFCAVYLLRGSRAQRSRLIHPEALLLKADRIDHLHGRDDDLDRLAAVCIAEPQINVIGESGAGKTALLRSGLCPRFSMEGSLFVPVYVDIWGRDWAEGPRRAVLDSVQRLLGPERRQNIDEATDVRSALTAVRQMLQRTPLVIFDQFDDYQTQHIERFLPPTRRTWISADELAAENPFWNDIRSLLVSEQIHCVFVTRADAAAGVEAVRFLKPVTYSLDRLRQAFVVPLLAQLTATRDGAEVVMHPENGWTVLRERLARDLGASGAVLPAQMKLALKGLGNLDALNDAEYDRHGGLAGLEAADVEWHIAHAASSTAIGARDRLALLMAMVDARSQKTVPRTSAELAEVIPATVATIEYLLDEWQTRELVRMRTIPDTGEKMWVLDHDYLCRGVLAAERRADRWGTALRDAYEAFRAAGTGWKARWRALLPIGTQLRLAFERLRGRLEYGRTVRYAALSTLRFAPLLIVLVLLVLSGREWYRIRVSSQGQSLVDRIGVEYNDDLLIRDIAAASEDVRISILHQALSSPARAERLDSWIPQVINAIVQFDPETRQRIAEEVVLPTIEDPERIRFGLDLADALDLEDPRLAAKAVEQRDSYTLSHLPRRSWKNFIAGMSESQRVETAGALLDCCAERAQEICATIPSGRCADIVAAEIARAPGSVRGATASLIQAFGKPSPHMAAKARTALLARLSDPDFPILSAARALVAHGPLNDAEERALVDAVVRTPDGNLNVSGVVFLDERLRTSFPDTLWTRLALRTPDDEREIAAIVERLSLPAKREVLDKLLRQATTISEPRLMRMILRLDLLPAERERLAAAIFRAIETGKFTDNTLKTAALLPDSKKRTQAAACAWLGFDPIEVGTLIHFVQGVELSECPAAYSLIVPHVWEWLNDNSPPSRPWAINNVAAYHFVASPEDRRKLLDHWRQAPAKWQTIRTGAALVVLVPDLDERTRAEIVRTALQSIDPSEIDHVEVEAIGTILDKAQVRPREDDVRRAAESLAVRTPAGGWLWRGRDDLSEPTSLGDLDDLLRRLLRLLPARDRRPILDRYLAQLPSLNGSEATTALVMAREFGVMLDRRVLAEIPRNPDCRRPCRLAVVDAMSRTTGQRFESVWDIPRSFRH
jgi:hypothetical protein